MYRLTDKDIEVELAVAFTIEFRKHLTALRAVDRSKREAAERAILAKLLSVVSNAGTCVVRADSTSFHNSGQRGKFGQDEPWPAKLFLERYVSGL